MEIDIRDIRQGRDVEVDTHCMAVITSKDALPQSISLSHTPSLISRLDFHTHAQ